MEKIELRKEMFAMVEAWQESGLTQKSYAVQAGIKYSKFHYWLKQYRESTSQDAAFVELQTGYAHPIVIRYPDGVEISLPVQIPLPFIKALIN